MTKAIARQRLGDVVISQQRLVAAGSQKSRGMLSWILQREIALLIQPCKTNFGLLTSETV